MTLFTGAKYNRLFELAVQRQELSRAPGTQAHYRMVKREYLNFCFANNIKALKPGPMDICIYIESLMEQGVSPNTVRNKIAAVRKYLRLSDGDLKGINGIRVKLALDA